MTTATVALEPKEVRTETWAATPQIASDMSEPSIFGVFRIVAIAVAGTLVVVYLASRIVF